MKKSPDNLLAIETALKADSAKRALQLASASTRSCTFPVARASASAVPAPPSLSASLHALATVLSVRLQEEQLGGATVTVCCYCFVDCSAPSQPNVRTGFLTLDAATAGSVYDDFPTYSTLSTHVLLPRVCDADTERKVQLWLLRPARVHYYYGSASTELQAMLELQDLCRLVRGVYSHANGAGSFADQLQSAPNFLKALFVQQRSSTAAPQLKAATAPLAGDFARIFNYWAHISGLHLKSLDATDSPAAVATLRSLFGGLANAKHVAKPAARPAGGHAPGVAGSVPRLTADSELASFSTAGSWANHFRCKIFRPQLRLADLHTSELAGKLLVWSFTNIGAQLDWDCAVIRKFDMRLKMADLVQVYEPYTIHLKRADTFLFNPAHFVLDLKHAVRNPKDASFLPWLFLEYPEHPCDGFPK